MQTEFLVSNPTSRRGFIKLTAAGVMEYMAMGGAVGLATMGTACNVFNDIVNWIPVADAALDNIVELLETAGVINPVAALPINALLGVVTASIAQLKADVAAYQAVTPPPVGALAKIVLGLQIVTTNFQAFLAALNISDDKLLQLVVGFAQIVLGTIAGFENTIAQQNPTAAPTPAPAPAPALHVTREYQVARQAVTVMPQHRTRRKFKKDWNHLAEQYGHSELKMHISLAEALIPD